MDSIFEETLVKQYDNDTYINGRDSLELFFEDYPGARDKRCFYENFYKDYVTMFVNLPFNFKATFEYKIEYKSGISQSTLISSLQYDAPTIKVYKMSGDYSKAKSAAYLNELTLLKEKYNIKDKKE